MISRTYVACDVSNLWRSCQDQYGPDARVDFKSLSQVVASRHDQIQQDLNAYVVTGVKQNHHNFHQALKGFGYAVKERFMRYDKASNKPTGTDWDVGITIDALDKIDSYEEFALMSGDGDFAQLLTHLKGKGKRTMVFSFGASCANALYDAAQEVVILGAEHVYFR